MLCIFAVPYEMLVSFYPDLGRRRWSPGTTFHPRRSHGENQRLFLEHESSLGHLLRFRGQHHASLANGREYLQRRRVGNARQRAGVIYIIHYKRHALSPRLRDDKYV